MEKQQVKLQHSITTDPDLDGFNFYVQYMKPFYADDYELAYNVVPENTEEVEEAANQLKAGQWLHVWHEARS